MLICILTKNVITSCSVTMMLFLHLEVKPLMTLTTVLYLSCALISEIGRASCRERVYISVVAGALKKKREGHANRARQAKQKDRQKLRHGYESRVRVDQQQGEGRV